MNETPTVTWANPRDKRVDYQCYIDGKIKVRVFHSGVVQYAVGDNDWTDAV